jgi:hypothetical protein
MVSKFGADAPHCFVPQVELWLRVCAGSVVYLAVHPAGSLPVRGAVPVVVGCPVKHVYHACSAVGRAAIPSPGTRLEEQAKIVNDADMCSVLFV